jgi:PAS domain S-box-containing protein
MIEDISERKQAEEQQRKNDATLRALLDNVPYLIWLKDVDSRFVAVNGALLKTTGRASMDEVLGKTDFDLWPRELAVKYRADDIEVMASREQKLTVERALDNGELRWVETFKTPILDHFGNLLGTTGFAHDITDRIEQEERRLLEVREQRDVLVREVHHRIKNNLQGVVGLLRQHALDYPGMKEVIEVTIGRIYSIALIHGMQAQTLSEEVDLCRLIASVIDASDGGVDYQTDMGCPVLLNREEAVPIALVLNELVTNACKHRIANTLVVVRLDVAGDGALITITNHFEDSAQEEMSGGQGLNLVKSLMPRKCADLAVTRTGDIFTVELTLSPPVTIVRNDES